MNVFLIEDEGGVTVFDAGISADDAARSARPARRFGGIRRVVLGHADCDHRGGAAGLDAPVYCHPLERSAAQSPSPVPRLLEPEPAERVGAAGLPRLLARWDGGALEIAGTLEEGDEVAGFSVLHLPGHAPGLIALYREEDGLALVSDLLLHAQPRDRDRQRRARAASGLQPRHRPGARRRSGAWPRSTRRSSGPGTPSRSPALTSSCNCSAPPRLRSSLSADGQARTQALQRGDRPAGQRPRRRLPTTVYTDADGNELELRGSLTPKARAEYAATLSGGLAPRGRLAARDRAAVRAAGRLVDDLRAADRRSRRSCSGATGWPARHERALRARQPARTRRRELPGAAGAVIDADAFAVLIADWCLEVQPRAADPDRDDARSRRSRRSRCTGRCSNAAAWPLLRLTPRGLEADFFRHARDQHLDGVAPIELAEAEAADASVRIMRAGEHQPAGRRRPGAASRGGRAPRSRCARRARGSAGALTIWPTPALAQQAGMAERDYADFVERALFLDQPDPVAAWARAARARRRA